MLYALNFKKGVVHISISTWGNTLVKRIKSYIYNNLNHAKLYVIGTTKDSFTQPLSVKEIPDKLKTSNDNY